jgi:hypothetical protein
MNEIELRTWKESQSVFSLKNSKLFSIIWYCVVCRFKDVHIALYLLGLWIVLNIHPLGLWLWITLNIHLLLLGWWVVLSIFIIVRRMIGWHIDWMIRWTGKFSFVMISSTNDLMARRIIERCSQAAYKCINKSSDIAEICHYHQYIRC